MMIDFIILPKVWHAFDTFFIFQNENSDTVRVSKFGLWRWRESMLLRILIIN